MNRFTTRYTSWKTITLPALAFIWCLGFASGYWLCIPQGSECLDLFQSVCLRDIAFERSLIASLIPVILSALIFRYAAPSLILPIVFTESFISGYCHSLILLCFGRAGWLIVTLFWCPRSVSNVILINYWISNIDNAEERNTVRLRRTIAICFLVSVLEHMLIRPSGIEFISKY